MCIYVYVYVYSYIHRETKDLEGEVSSLGDEGQNYGGGGEI